MDVTILSETHKGAVVKEVGQHAFDPEGKRFH